MQPDSSLGSAFVGGIIGAAVGVGLQVVIETGLAGARFEASWFPIVIGLLTGIGVRMACRGCMSRNYARGAVSALIALAAIVASSFAVREVMKRREVTLNAAPAAARAADDEADDTGPDASDASSAEDAAKVAARPTLGAPSTGTPAARPSAISPWQFVFMALGALVAYELGRGPDPAKRAGEDPRPEEPLVGGTDPSN